MILLGFTIGFSSWVPFSFAFSGESSSSYWSCHRRGTGADLANVGKLGRDSRDLLLRRKEGAGSDAVAAAAV